MRVVRSDQRIADKMLITAALIALGSITFPNVVIARRERAVSSLRVAAAQQGRN